MSQENVELAERLNAMLLAGDIDGALALIADDLVWTTGSGGNSTRHCSTPGRLRTCPGSGRRRSSTQKRHVRGSGLSACD
jgi:ketosteroid isomerase-like protein